MYFVMHRAGVTGLKTSHLIHPLSKDTPNNFVPFPGVLMGQGTGCLHCKAPVTSAASAVFVLLVAYIYIPIWYLKTILYCILLY